LRRFEQIDHPSDIGIIAYGKTPLELFESAAYGMLSLTADLSRVEPRSELEVDVSGEDRESMLINWLNELLYVSDSRKMTIGKVNILKLGKNGLSARVTGEKADTAKHDIVRSIKAATYNQLEIKKSRGVLSARVVFDV